MATLTVDEVDPALVRRLHDRAAAEGVSAEELHRRILARALGEPKTGRDIVEAFRELGRLGLEIPMEDRDKIDDRPPPEF
jgi:plasmid stability protein